MAALRVLILTGSAVILWFAGWFFAGGNLVPAPRAVLSTLAAIIGNLTLFDNISVTLFRGTAALISAYLFALPAGIACGLNKNFMDMVSPVVTFLQSLPPVVWIAVIMIWTGTGSTLPVIVAGVSLFPVIFFSTALAVHSIDRELFRVAKVYRVKRRAFLAGVILPAISGSLAGSLSYSLGAVWKVTATAEFFGSADGIGSRLYLSFRQLDMPSLFAWTIVIAAVSIVIDMSIVRYLRGRVNRGMERSR